MGRTQKILLVGIALLAVVVVFFATRNRQPPILPEDANHAGFSIPNCLRCHGPQGEKPRGMNHPVGDDCARCHGTR